MTERELSIIRALGEEFATVLADLQRTFEEKMAAQSGAFEEKLASLSALLQKHVTVDEVRPVLQAMMNDVIGYRVVSEPRLPTTLAVNGWLLPIPVDGFVLLSCEQKQKIHPQPARTAMVQCVYSDGLASISVFLEPFSEERHRYEGQELRLGATHTLSGRVAGDSWVTMIGEVPLATLRRFASAIKQAPH